MKLTFIDAGVLIAAARGNHELSTNALTILSDPEREFVSSDFVKLEVLPKPVHYGNMAEVEFYEIFFEAVKQWVDVSDELVKKAYQEACQAGLSAIDAIHVAAAILANATELVTTEKPEKVIHRTTSIKVVSIQDN